MKARPILFGLGAIGLWSTNAVVAKHALAVLSVAQVQCLQFAGAAAVFALLRARNGGYGTPIPPADAMAVGLVGLVGTMVFQYLAFASGPIAVVNLLAYAWPLLTALIVVGGGRSAYPGRLAVASLAGFVGVALLIGGSPASDGMVPGQAWAGYGFAAASAVCMAAYSVGVSRVRSSPADVLLPASLAGLAGTAIWWAATSAGTPSLSGAAMGLYLGIGPMGLGYVLWSYAMRGGAVGAMSTLGYATPVLSTSWLIASGEPLTARALAGGLLIVAACVAAGFYRRERPVDDTA